MTAELYLGCAECGESRAFEQPPCADGHGADCPERFCLDCGTAVLLDPPLTEPSRRPGSVRRAA